MELNIRPKSLHLRLQSCIQTVLEVHQALDTSQLVPELTDRFLELKQTLLDLDAAVIEEDDVKRVEAATNRLLGELKPLLEIRGLDKLSQETAH